MPIWPNAFLLVAAMVTASAAASEYRHGVMSARGVGAALALTPLAHFAWGASSGGLAGGVEAALFSLAGGAICGAIPYGAFRLGLMGKREVELLATIGALLRPMIGVEAMFYGFLVAAVYLPVVFAYRGTLIRTTISTLGTMLNPFLPVERRRALPLEIVDPVRFGVASFIGVLITCLMHWRLR